MAVIHAFLDTNVLFSATLRDILLRLAVADAYRPLWSAESRSELRAIFHRKRSNIDQTKLDRLFHLMDAVLEEHLVENYEPLIKTIQLPDTNDRHIVAAAAQGKGHYIVTLNIRDFPKYALQPYGLAAIHPDDFIHLLSLFAPDTVLKTLNQHRSQLKNPPFPPQAYLQMLNNHQLTLTSSFYRIHSCDLW